MNMQLTFIRFNPEHSIKDRCKQISLKGTAKTYKDSFYKAAQRLYTHGVKQEEVVKGLCEQAYGVNIGEQVFNALTQSQFNKIISNIKLSLED